MIHIPDPKLTPHSGIIARNIRITEQHARIRDTLESLHADRVVERIGQPRFGEEDVAFARAGRVAEPGHVFARVVFDDGGLADVVYDGVTVRADGDGEGRSDAGVG